MIFCAVLMIYPVLYSLTLGFRNAIVETFVGGEMNFNGLANYQSVIADRVFWKALANTVLFTVLSLVNKSFGKASSLRPVGSLLAVSASQKSYCLVQCPRNNISYQPV